MVILYKDSVEIHESIQRNLREKMMKETDFRKSFLVSDVGSRKNPEFVEIFPTAVQGSSMYVEM